MDRVIQVSARSESVSVAMATATVTRFHSDVMDRLADGAYYTSSTRCRFLA